MADSNLKLKDAIANPRRSLFILSYPLLAAMVVQIAYEIVDVAFVGRLGANALAALTFSFPFYFLIFALDAGIGAGVNSRVSRYLGEKKKKAAENAAMHGLFWSLVFAVIVLILGLIFIRPLLMLMGAQGEVLNPAIDYLRIIFLGSVVIFPAFMLSTIYGSYGDTKTYMKIQISGLILNIILDPIFIYWMGLGVKGAAIATVISIAFTLLVSFFYLSKIKYFKLDIRAFKFSKKITKDIFKIGLPATSVFLVMTFYVAFLNKAASKFGPEYVSVFGIVSTLESVAILPVVAVAAALLTLTGMLYGAKKYHLVEEISWYSLRVSIVMAAAVGAIFFLIPGIFLKIFTNDPKILDVGFMYLRLDAITFPLMAVVLVTGRIAQGIGRGSPALIINSLRVFLFAIPLAYLFVFYFNLSFISIVLAMIIAGVLASIISIIWLYVVFIKFRKKCLETECR